MARRLLFKQRVLEPGVTAHSLVGMSLSMNRSREAASARSKVHRIAFQGRKTLRDE